MNNNEITDHSLHLLIDGQLDQSTREKLKQQIDASPELQQKLKRITEVKELVSLAYIQKHPRPVSRNKNPLFLPLPYFVALTASLIMALGLTLGWLAHQQYDGSKYVVAEMLTRPNISNQKIPLIQSLQGDRKFMLHFDTLNDAQLKRALIETSSILDSYANSNLPVQVDLLFDQQSVLMFRPQHAIQIEQLKGLINDYTNVQIFACSDSLKMFLEEKEISRDISLFHTNRVVREMIPERIDQGWIYLKV